MDLTHIDRDGNARMVEVGDKEVTRREAVAEGWICINDAALEAVTDGTATKGDVLAVARIAAIQGAKRTSELVPLCHPLALTGVDICMAVDQERSRIGCRAAVRCSGRTGVEMEALTAVSIGLLTVYDMLKSVDREMEIEGVRLLEKSGGRSGLWRRP